MNRQVNMSVPEPVWRQLKLLAERQGCAVATAALMVVQEALALMVFIDEKERNAADITMLEEAS